MTPGKVIAEYDRVEEAFKKIQSNKHPILITGSFYLIGGVLPLLDPVNYPREEVSLNEWGAVLNGEFRH